jgi:hypothetical protein
LPGDYLTSLEPWSEESLDLAAPARRFQPSHDGLVLDDDERRRPLEPKAFDQVGALGLLHAVELKRGVVTAPLQHLRDETLRAPARA